MNEFTKKKLKQLIDEQSRDEGLWFIADYASEDYLQKALRKLHFYVEEMFLMNDFTKQQLEDIYYDLSNDDAVGRCDERILNKLQYMIDNYYERGSECDWPVCVDKCKRCGAIVNDNQ